MKTNAIKNGCISLLISGVMVLAVGVNTASAQDNSKKETKVIRVERVMKGEGGMMIPGLTQEQQTKMKNLRGEHMKAIQLLRAQHAEKAAHLKTLTLADKADVKAINKTIDEMMALKGEILKQGVSFKLAVKDILTPEQLREFQGHMMNMRHQRGGMAFGRGRMMEDQEDGMQFGRGHMMRGQGGMGRNQNMPLRERMNIRIHKEDGKVINADTTIVK
ncbi:MAG: Spy/CpxP family protein refolding chaperone [Bacteroidetes bacterium]|nr:Spy/CpxP family protein refolding chaperone [Bacteroidota bacterium]